LAWLFGAALSRDKTNLLKKNQPVHIKKEAPTKKNAPMITIKMKMPARD
jgi:hypothetical protein